MKIDWVELKKGLDKEGNWLTDTYQGVKDGVGDWFSRGATAVGGKVDGVVNSIPGVGLAKGMDGMMKNLGNVAMAGLPLLAAMGKGKSRGGAAPNIHIELGRPKTMLGAAPGEVRSLSSPKLAQLEQNQKFANILDPSVLRTVVLSRVTNDVLNQMAQNRQQSPIDEQSLELVSKYPEMQKMLADPQTKAYLETLLTKKSHKQPDEKDIHSES
jgi:hypothetical protein